MVSSQTKVDRLKAALTVEVLNGKYGVGDKLPSIRELAKNFQVSHITASQAVSGLSASGLVSVRPGVGAFVSSSVQKNDAEQNTVIGLAELASNTAEFSQSAYAMLTPYLINGFNGYFADGRAIMRLFPYEKWNLTSPGTDLRLALESNQIGGIIVNGPIKPEEADFILECQIPMVVCNHLLPERQVAKVFINWQSGFRKLLSRLVNAGHRRIEVITYAEEWVVKHNGVNGYVHAAHGLGLGSFSHNNIHIVNNVVTPLSCQRYDEIVAQAMAQDPSAIVAFDETIANRVVRYCYDNGAKVPDDISLVTLNDMMPGSHPISLTSLNSQVALQDMMWEACAIVDQAIKGNVISNERVLVSTSVVEGESVSRPCVSCK